VLKIHRESLQNPELRFHLHKSIIFPCEITLPIGFEQSTAGGRESHQLQRCHQRLPRGMAAGVAVAGAASRAGTADQCDPRWLLANLGDMSWDMY